MNGLVAATSSTVSAEVLAITRGIERLTPGDSVHLSSGKSGSVFVAPHSKGPSISLDDHGALYFSSVDESVQVESAGNWQAPNPGDTLEPGARLRIAGIAASPVEVIVPTPLITQHFNSSDLPKEASRPLQEQPDDLCFDSNVLKALLRSALGNYSSVERPLPIALDALPDGNVALIGREGAPGLRVDGSAVSRKHLEVTLNAAGLLEVKDTSSYGTEIREGDAWVKMPKNEVAVIAPGNLLRLGGTSGAYIVLGATDTESVSRSNVA